ncbi:MAG: Maf family nucleotide pyrophosphatase [Parvularculaceae bacterium]
MSASPLILASASPRRKALLQMIGVTPDEIIPADIDETELPRETAATYVARVARGKAEKIAAERKDAFVLAADTCVAVGRRILPKAEDEQTARDCLALLSGRSHRVFSGVALISPDGALRERVVETRVKVVRLTDQVIEEYIASKEWDGKAGGYAIQGLFARHVISIIGSHPNVIGLPLYETANLLDGAGWWK